MKAICEHCGATYSVSERHLGKSVSCQKCSEPFFIRSPTPGAAPHSHGTDESPHISAKCNSCQSKFRANPSLIGKTLKCPNCSEPLLVAAVDKSQADSDRGIHKKVAEEPASNQTKDAETENPVFGRRIAATRLLSCLAVLAVLTVCAYWLGWIGNKSNGNEVAETSSTPKVLDDSETKTKPEPPTIPGAKKKKASTNKKVRRNMLPLVDTEPREEFGYRFKLTANVPGQGELAWEGTTVISPKHQREVKFITGVAIAERAIIVPYSEIIDCTSVTVLIDGKPHPVYIQAKLKNLQMATLVVDQGTHFARPIADKEDRLGKRANKVRAVWLNEGGNIQTKSDITLDGGRDGIEYYIKPGTLPGEAVGGILLRDSGRIAGYITGVSKYRIAVSPWSRIASGWGKRQANHFDYETEIENGSTQEVIENISKHLVQVIIARPAEQKRTPDKDYLFHTTVNSKNPLQEKSIGKWNLHDHFENNTQKNISLDYSRGKGLRVEAKRVLTRNRKQADQLYQLPFGVGSPCLKAFEFVADPSLKMWQEKRKMLFRTSREFQLRPVANTVKAGEKHFWQNEQFDVVSASPGRFELERTTELSPTSKKDQAKYRIAGKERIIVNPKTNWVSIRDFNGTFEFQDEDGLSVVIPFDFKMTSMLPRETKKIRPYWR